MNTNYVGRSETSLRALEFQQIGSSAVQKAQLESRELGIPNVYSLNSVLHYELPDGRLTTKDPYKQGMWYGVRKTPAIIRQAMKYVVNEFYRMSPP